MAVETDVQKLDPGSALVALYELDASSIGGTTLHFHNHTSNAGSGVGNLVFGGVTYTKFPIHVEGFERSSKGQLPRPKLVVSNIGGVIGAILRTTSDLIGCKLTRTRTFQKYLDGEASADPTVHFPLDIWYIDRKARETNTFVEFELAANIDVEGVQLPRRQIVSGTCPWVYRGTECGYAGVPVTDASGNLLSPLHDHGAWDAGTGYLVGDYIYVLVNGIRIYYVALGTVTAGTAVSDTTAWVQDACQKTVAACKLHFGATDPLSFGGFPGTNKLPRV